MNNKIGILFVCTGNICRSPLAHRLFEKLAKEQNRQNDFFVDSCGTGVWHSGQNADGRVCKLAEEKGWQLNKIARKIQLRDIETFDHIFIMDNSHFMEIRRMLPSSKQHLLSKVQYLREHDPFASEGDRAVSDPYYGGDAMFYTVYEMIERSCKQMLSIL